MVNMLTKMVTYVLTSFQTMILRVVILGSPVMNAWGELVGTAFDGNWEVYER